jgi:hypothetical protein
MKIFSLIITISAMVSLFSCSEDASTTTQQTDNRASEDNVFSDQVKALEKAEQVEGQILDAFKKRDASIDEN